MKKIVENIKELKCIKNTGNIKGIILMSALSLTYVHKTHYNAIVLGYPFLGSGVCDRRYK